MIWLLYARASFGALRALVCYVFMSALSVRLAFAYAAGGYFLT